ncbi:MAG: hypothetical protein US19_C0055G0001 [Candidatus Daviesbacteria bacterium GW2011_GWB1_36_5]|uniref:Protein GrpE n=1 Tax=Candidatus Daviesbacteria bacterium GW2011_GWB1_36_5 TaxID=1618426 RepID=A0A0G0ENU1_9BACT|nr:MAG: hypothetical protein US19_C0055G0001 [Candidatus Daviesbacteria bacterium GW2011_GWB1_36_5]
MDTREGEDGKILKVVRKGYKINGKTLRAAQVVVMRQKVDQNVEDKAQKAEESFINTFQKGEIPEKIEEIKGSGSLGAVLVLKKIVASMSEWRRLVDEGAVKKLSEKGEDKITDFKIFATPGVYKIGKRRFIKIK